jgi:hypothetical protein
LTKEETRKFTALKRTMAMEDPKEEEEQEEPAKVVTQEFNDLTDQEEQTKQEKKSDQTKKEDTECGPRDPCWGKMSMIEHPSSEERLEEINKYGIGRHFLSYVEAERYYPGSRQ